MSRAYRSTGETCVLIALLVKRSRQRQLRISKQTVPALLGKRSLTASVTKELCDFIFAAYNVVMFENSRGGFSLIPVGSLDGAPTATLALLRPSEMAALSNGGQELDTFLTAAFQEADAHFYASDMTEEDEGAG